MLDIHGKKIWILLVLFGVVVILAALVIRQQFRPTKITPMIPALEDVSAPTPRSSLEPNDGDIFRSEVPAGIIVPGPGEILSPAQQKAIAVPDTVSPAAPGAVSSFRSFSISGDGGEFIPKKVIVRLGDIVNINFTAVDGDYDIVFPSYNMSQLAQQGQTKILQFQAISEGAFLYYCSSCGGPDSRASGQIIVVAE